MNELKKSEETSPRKVSRRAGLRKNGEKVRKEYKKEQVIVIEIILLIIFSAGFLALRSYSVREGAKATAASYAAAYDREKENTYQKLYEKYYQLAEREYHVSNRVAVEIGGLREMAALEVMSVSDIEYILEDSEDNDKGITSWLEVPGQGTYVVDLQAAEFVVDDERDYVLTRVPYPELTNVSINYAGVKKLFFANNILNDSYNVGEDLARRQLSQADVLIKKAFASNQYFYLSAQEAAVSTIQCLVKELNPEIPELTVEVEFF